MNDTRAEIHQTGFMSFHLFFNSTENSSHKIYIIPFICFIEKAVFFFFGLPQFTHIHIYTYIHLACKYLIIIDYRLIRVLFMPEDYTNYMLSCHGKPGKSNVSNDCKIISGCCFSFMIICII